MPVRFAIIGSGNICRTYFQAFTQIADGEITALVSRSGNRPSFVGKKVEIAGELETIRNEYDAVIIATPNGLHHKGAIAAAGLGKHVLTEKPLDISILNMDEMISACKKSEVRLGTVYQHRMSPDILQLKKMLDENRFGRLFSADYSVRCWRDQSYYDSAEWRGTWEIDGGGPFLQQACHELDLYIWYFGMPEGVQSLTGTFAHNIEVEDTGAALFHHTDGMIGTFSATTNAYPGFPPVLTLQTEKGTVIVTNGKITGWHINGISNPSRSAGEKLHSGAGSAQVADTFGHEVIIKDFISAIRNNHEPAVPGESARKATELALRIYGRV